MKTAVVILNWNTEDFLRKFLPPLLKSVSKAEDAEVIAGRMVGEIAHQGGGDQIDGHTHRKQDDDPSAGAEREDACIQSRAILAKNQDEQDRQQNEKAERRIKAGGAVTADSAVEEGAERGDPIKIFRKGKSEQRERKREQHRQRGEMRKGDIGGKRDSRKRKRIAGKITANRAPCREESKGRYRRRCMGKDMFETLQQGGHGIGSFRRNREWERQCERNTGERMSEMRLCLLL